MKQTHLLKRLGLAALFAASSFGTLAAPAHALDSVVGDGTPESCTEAAFDEIWSAVLADPVNSTITFNCGGPATIPFTTEKVFTVPSGVANHTITLDGAGLITLDGQDTTRLFRQTASLTLGLQNLTLTRGFAGGEGDANHSGGAILVEAGILGLRNVRLINNRSMDKGGAFAIMKDGGLSMHDSAISANTAVRSGGGIYSEMPLLIERSTISDNVVEGTGDAQSTPCHNGGGGITALAYPGAQVGIYHTNLYRNSALTGSGGGLCADLGEVVLGDADIRGNSALNGGGVAGIDISIFYNSIVGNAAVRNGGGLYFEGNGGFGGALRLRLLSNR
jgi:hypothetical protein